MAGLECGRTQGWLSAGGSRPFSSPWTGMEALRRGGVTWLRRQVRIGSQASTVHTDAPTLRENGGGTAGMWVPPVGRAPPGRPPAGSLAGEESAGAGGSSPPLRARLLPPPGAPGRGPASWRRLAVGGRPGRGRACIPSATRLGRRPHAGSRVSLHGRGGAGAGRERSAASASRRGLGGPGRGLGGALGHHLSASSSTQKLGSPGRAP